MNIMKSLLAMCYIFPSKNPARRTSGPRSYICRFPVGIHIMLKYMFNAANSLLLLHKPTIPIACNTMIHVDDQFNLVELALSDY